MGSSAIVDIVLRSLAVYAAVLVGLRLVGKRRLGQMSVPDVVVILLIANAVQNAMVGADVSLGGGLVSAATLLVANVAVSRLRIAWPTFGRLVEGTPTLLVHDGRFVTDNLRREGIQRDEVESILREHGVAEVGDVRVAYLEPDGAISVIPRTSEVIRAGAPARRARRTPRR